MHKPSFEALRPVLHQTPAEPLTLPTASPLPQAHKGAPSSGFLQRLRAPSALWLSGGALVLIILAALASPWLAPFDPTAVSLSDSFAPPSAVHWFGADQIGRDVLSRSLYGARLSLFIAFCTVALAGIFGTALGICAGYLGGAVDTVVTRLADIQLAFPAVILAMVLAGAIGIDLTNLIVLLALAHWARFARVTRGEVLSLRTRDFVLLARLADVSPLLIMWRHIGPNLVGTFVVLATLDIGSVIILESTLSFLGLGVQPPLPSWGSMIAEGRGFLETAWWVCTVPGVLLVITVLAANRFGDALRDRLNPMIPEGS